MALTRGAEGPAVRVIITMSVAMLRMGCAIRIAPILKILRSRLPLVAVIRPRGNSGDTAAAPWAVQKLAVRMSPV